MSNPRIEEVDDEDDIASDPEEMDPSTFDFARPQGSSLQPAMDPAASRMDPAMLQNMLQPQNQQQPGAGMTARDRERIMREQKEKTKNYQCIYPVYFDRNRSREEGRRIGKELAVENPLARGIVDALQEIGRQEGVGLQIAFEPAKCHPKDWANPGRVKVLVKQGGRPISSKIQNKHHLYKKIATYLQSHPTTADDPLKLRIQGVPLPKDGKPPAPQVPRGWKMNTVLPLHSPALTGGGVSDNMLKDMMAEMGGQLPPGMEGMVGGGAGGGGGSSSGGAKKKDKKKK
ncbi:signal recognition particle, SRP19 subunit [Polychaeton citri CBS 116435]|uniref:Signal recognition particle, SRP19 subunit n=1 Tax=Polychaeton citri CBS 116435 TaxID=1314669 RepID=A0A9P4QF12_9PEZI|nr:signal recognition particle, SRP19 subunit [Polychaeton citri CBS 116435]